MNKAYPSGTVRALLKTDEVTVATRNVLIERLEKETVTEPSFFDKETFDLLHAVCDCLIPQPNKRKKVDLAVSLDNIFNKDEGTGWRYDKMPSHHKAFLIGLNGIEETSGLLFNKEFQQLDINQQQQVLTSVQNKTAVGKTWELLPSNLFFEELLARITEIYYSYPLALEEIGVVSMADAKGWTKIELNNLEEREPKLITKTRVE